MYVLVRYVQVNYVTIWFGTFTVIQVNTFPGVSQTLTEKCWCIFLPLEWFTICNKSNVENRTSLEWTRNPNFWVTWNEAYVIVVSSLQSSVAIVFITPSLNISNFSISGQHPFLTSDSCFSKSVEYGQLFYWNSSAGPQTLVLINCLLNNLVTRPVDGFSYADTHNYASLQFRMTWNKMGFMVQASGEFRDRSCPMRSLAREGRRSGSRFYRVILNYADNFGSRTKLL